MKKIHIIFKTHLDMGFTDLAAEVLEKYRTSFIPEAVRLAETLNTPQKTRFIWTTGSWLIRDSLENASAPNKERLAKAIEKGYIRWHGLPFTTHTELLDEETFRYGLSISAELDARFGKKTVAAKMTDVPGHTAAMLPYLNEAGIRLLHLGVNAASAVPAVPEAFVWKYKESSVVTLYEGDYGGMYQNPHIDDILYFFHSSDNHGPSNEAEITRLYKRLEKKYPDYAICASTLDDYALAILPVADKLPVMEGEIGDTWLHGTATDPYKVGAFKELAALRDAWVKDGKIQKGDSEYRAVCEGLLLVAEHTWGLDVKRHLSDYVYPKEEFRIAKAKNFCKTKWQKGAMLNSLVTFILRARGEFAHRGSYQKMEESWKEQRAYLETAVAALAPNRRQEANARFAALRPKEGFSSADALRVLPDTPVQLGEYTLRFRSGGLHSLAYEGHELLNGEQAATLVYRAYSGKDYAFWKAHYTRDYPKTRTWSEPDFLRPGLAALDGTYPEGRFSYAVTELFTDGESVVARLRTATEVSARLGAPREAELKFSAVKNKLKIELLWLEKDESRFTEALFFHLPFAAKTVSYRKLGYEIDPFSVVKDGSRNLASTQSVILTGEETVTTVLSRHAPLTSLGAGKILEFDNGFAKPQEGVSFVLQNNVWGTNFPLWYGENARFEFLVETKYL